MAWYRSGTVTVANGSTAVTGAGTDFVQNTQAGEAFRGPDGRTYEIAAVVSATQLTLGETYMGGSGAGQAYAISPTASLARDLALGVSLLLNGFAAVRDGVGQGLFPDGTAAAPGVRFAADHDTGLRRAAANVLALVAGGRDRLTIGDTADLDAFNLRLGPVAASSGNGGNVRLRNDAGTMQWLAGMLGLAGSTAFSIYNIVTASEAMRVEADSIVRFPKGFGPTGPAQQGDRGSAGLISYEHPVTRHFMGDGTGYRIAFSSRVGGVTTDRVIITDGGLLVVGLSSATTHAIYSPISAGTILAVGSASTAARSLNVAAVDAEGASGVATALYVGRATSSGRSINAGGTLNASGADYAEYMTKAVGCDTIAKGDVCGVDVEGNLTKTWADARSFVIKSTDPSYVGGDTWGQSVGPRPEGPGEEPAAPIAPPAGPASEDEADVAAWQAIVAAYPAQQAAHKSAHATWTTAKAAYDTALPAWKAALEVERQKVDRIAFAGQVPLNVSGDFAVGDYIIAAASGAGIKAVAVPAEGIPLDVYLRRVGKVWAVRDGRAWVDVQHG